METSVSMKTTDTAGKKNTTTLSYVNPNASNEQLKTYAEKLASLTSDTYNGATKIEKTDLDEEQVAKLPRNPYMTHVVNNNEQTISGAIFTSDITTPPEEGIGFSTEDVIWDIHYQGDSISTCYLITDSNSGAAFFDIGMSPPAPSNGVIYFGLTRVGDGSLGLENGQTATFTIHADATDLYEALDFVVTIQGGNG